MSTVPDPPPPSSRLRLAWLDHRHVGPAYVHWMNDPEVNRFLESRFTTHTEDSLHAFVEACHSDPRVHAFAIELVEGDRHIGNIKLGPVEAEHERGDIGLLIGDRDQWGKGIATEAVECLSAWAFSSLRLRKLTAGAYGSNVGSVRAFERAGFVVEGVRPAHYLTPDGPEDAVLLGRLRGRGLSAPTKRRGSVPGGAR